MYTFLYVSFSMSLIPINIYKTSAKTNFLCILTFMFIQFCYLVIILFLSLQIYSQISLFQDLLEHFHTAQCYNMLTYFFVL